MRSFFKQTVETDKKIFLEQCKVNIDPDKPGIQVHSQVKNHI